MDLTERDFHSGHRIGNVPLLAGTSFIELVRAVHSHASNERRALRIDEISFATFLFLDDSMSDILLQVELERQTDVS